MGEERLQLIENSLKLKNVEEFEIFLVERTMYESIFLKKNVENEREINDYEYIIRVLSQQSGGTGIGVIKGNSLNPKDIEEMIDDCVQMANLNTGLEYHFPAKVPVSAIETADKKIISDPLEVKKDIVEELLSEINQLQDVYTTFGRFRIHQQDAYLRNSNSINLESIRTFFFIEWALQTERNGRLAEYWDFDYYKERNHLNLNDRISKWSKLARDGLDAEKPKQNANAIVLFPPSVLNESVAHVVGLHSLGKSHTEKLSQYNIDDRVADEQFTLYDDGLLKGGFNSNSWDTEGNPRQRTEVIKNGLFKNRLYDQKYASHQNVKSTGNAIRTETGTVSNGTSNFEIMPGDISFEEIITDIKEGYYIDKFSWLRPDAISGFFGAEIRNGYYIKNGKIQNPIKLGNVSGNVLEMIKNCVYISKEREYSKNSLFPYIAFSNLNVSY